MGTGIILHHYDASPFTQKALRMLGLKQLGWRSVETPMLPPKDALVALTGGYRGTPVMQIGAEVFIDTQCIARELERRYPEPSLYPAGDRGLAHALVKWGDHFFQAGVAMALALLGPDWPEAFRRDREAIFRNLDLRSAQADLPHALAQFRASAALLDEQLADGRPFLTGDLPGLADLQAFGVPWFTRAALPVAGELLGDFQRLPAWEARIAELGEGEREEIDAALALDEAEAAQPNLTVHCAEPVVFGLAAGEPVEVVSDDFSDRGAVRGRLLQVDPWRISVHRESELLGDIVVHFPRLGYRLRPVRGSDAGQWGTI